MMAKFDDDDDDRPRRRRSEEDEDDDRPRRRRVDDEDDERVSDRPLRSARRADDDDEDYDDRPRRRRRREDDDEDDGPVIRRRGRLEYADFFARFGAALLDGLLLFVVNFAIAFPIGLLAGLNRVTPQQLQMMQAGMNLVSIIIQWLYFALQESGPNQATLGKRAVGLIVTDLDGRRISFGRATGRHFGKMLSGIICMIGFLMAAFTEKKQALHDMLAGTLVLRR